VFKLSIGLFTVVKTEKSGFEQNNAWYAVVPICLDRPYCLNCTKSVKLIVRKIIEIVATRCHILKLKCTKFYFGWGSAPHPAGELTALPKPPSWI